jgi:hypothetical protein
VARPERFEFSTLCFEGGCCIQLSYGRPFYSAFLGRNLVQLGQTPAAHALLAIGGELLVGRNIGPWGIYNNLKCAPAGAGVRLTLLTDSESLELRIVEPKIGNEVIAHHQGPSLRQHPVLLRISSHARRNNDDRDSKLIVGKKLTGGA